MIITAESIIAGFMITYAALVSQMLVSWSTKTGASLFTTLQAGLLTSLVVLTCFTSIVYLYRSTDSPDLRANSGNFQIGYDLFIAALLGTGLYVIFNILSWFRFSLLSFQGVQPYPISIQFEIPLSIAELSLSFLYVLILLHSPRWIQKAINYATRGNGRVIAESLGWAGLVVAIGLILLFTH